MSTLSLVVNGKSYSVDVDRNTPLLWVLRDTIGLTGTKYGCGISECGACTVHIDGVATRSCVTAVGDVKEKKITTIEGLSADSSHPLQKAWIAEQVPQCGYCQSGFIMTAAALLAKKPNPTDADIDNALSGHICRCGTYQRIRSAVHRAAAPQKEPVEKANSAHPLPSGRLCGERFSEQIHPRDAEYAETTQRIALFPTDSEAGE